MLSVRLKAECSAFVFWVERRNTMNNVFTMEEISINKKHSDECFKALKELLDKKREESDKLLASLPWYTRWRIYFEGAGVSMLYLPIFGVKNEWEAIKGIAGDVADTYRGQVLKALARQGDAERKVVQDYIISVWSVNGKNIENTAEALGLSEKYVKEMVKDGALINFEVKETYIGKGNYTFVATSPTPPAPAPPATTPPAPQVIETVLPPSTLPPRTPSQDTDMIKIGLVATMKAISDTSDLEVIKKGEKVLEELVVANRHRFVNIAKVQERFTEVHAVNTMEELRDAVKRLCNTIKAEFQELKPVTPGSLA